MRRPFVVVESPHVAIDRADIGRRGRHIDPLLGYQLLAVPFAPAQMQQPKARVITRARPDAAAPVSTAAHGLDLLSV